MSVIATPLQTFLYKLVRDHLPFGTIEQIVASIEGNAFLKHRLTEDHQAAWAESIEQRLTDDPTERQIHQPTFEEVWQATGYSYGDDALENVRLGWHLARRTLTKESPQSPTAASADDVAARPPVAGLTLAEAREADYILVVKGDTIKFLKDKRGNSTALDLVDPKEAYEITKEGARCRDTPGAVNPYPANTMKSQLHSQGWLTRDLQLCLARSNPRYRAQQLRGGSITEEGIRGGYGFESHTVFVEEKA